MSLLDSIFVNLRIISKIEDNGRISTTSPGQVELEKEGYTTTLWRTITGDSREKTGKFLKKLIDDATELSDDRINLLLSQKGQELSPLQNNENTKHRHELKKIGTGMNDAKRGINKLLATYNDDANITSKIEEVLDKIVVQVAKIEKALEILALADNNEN